MFTKAILLGTLGFSCIRLGAATIIPPQPEREFRGAWVPSVGNIQWPSKKGLPVTEQKSELLTILNRAQEMKLNAIILQVRPACDALYASKIEPWSEYLTGTMGKAPSPFYDPLAFAVTEAHKRGLELHAWINPYRARVLPSESPASPNHVSRKYPGMVVSYGKYLWLDPAQKAVQDYTLSVIADIVRRYDVDGLHMDDYFYPYAERDESKKYIPFPDDASWQKYQAAGGKLSRGDWRRQNVDVLVARAYQTVHATKPWVKFGVAPFGIWKPGVPSTIKGGNMFEEIYCDSLKWWTNGWVDYMSPQLYWPINPPDQSFTVLSKWWGEQNAMHRHLWPGLNTGKASGTNWPQNELVNQIRVTRSIPNAKGHIHWSMKSLMRSERVSNDIKELYAEPALVPASPWMQSAAPGKPNVAANRRHNEIKVHWTIKGREKPAHWVVQARTGNQWNTSILSGDKTSFTISSNGTSLPDAVAVSAVNRIGILGAATVVEPR